MPIHIVEDDPGVADSLRSLLQMLGHTVQLHESGESFFAARPPESSDTIIIDLGLPGIGGAQVLRWVSELKSQPHVIVITGQQKKAIAAAIAGIDAVDILRKPMTGDMLAAVLTRRNGTRPT